MYSPTIYEELGTLEYKEFAGEILLLDEERL